ncbi:MAG: STAS domain-containing protein [Spirochaetes bacterium]|nr:STAS domain-containing protein [Spirochaetota bacterium]
MELKVDKKSGVTVIEIIGDLDGTSAETAQKEISENITPGCSLIFNMEKCTFISSAGLRVLLVSAKHIKRENGKGALAGLSGDIKDVMEMTGFDHIFNNYDTISKAIEAVRKEK